MERKQFMKRTADTLLLMRGISKFYDTFLEEPRRRYSLSQIEVKILSFLSNNPDKDTAAEISYIRMLPKGNVSQAVDSLIKKGLILRIIDEHDKRKYHLKLTEKSVEITADIDRANDAYFEYVYQGFSAEEMELYMQMNQKILKNVLEGLEVKF